jgi:hypothetical protein
MSMEHSGTIDYPADPIWLVIVSPEFQKRKLIIYFSRDSEAEADLHEIFGASVMAPLTYFSRHLWSGTD